MIEYKPFSQVETENKEGINFEKIIEDRDPSIQSSLYAMRRLLENKKIKDLLVKQAPGLLKNSPWIDSGFGIYFATVANMKTTIGSRAMPIIDNQYTSSWANPLEIGFGVGFVEPWQGSKELLQLGTDNSELMINYDSPGGRYPARWAVATILNS
ncbi:hypothetical protein A2767_04115 [Candidatus Roizmanbacteria bacterium RIFCSPHIGHO2_01_FULL_35_10]|uniref:Uncharacterized protein n=1 Tax=Candidatus Roizmanbacteria bacterium RIFCSPLOWO2_01_FULL_35_13 TaxID=1802055 RepID=A0A1F7IH81_9BACT|nr:MAG: hypothetical protein A2767_04115 [Candidatus Roizmanbacteria bacterium RIFCSPHIGHO2_01_FULL_35_10]OGK42726.1 MAG: hypothetical protein A3A74_00740 [Candidatus Roizmanbacteria bacterium RIFCSPLOWO2_01_FULL_35_13]